MLCPVLPSCLKGVAFELQNAHHGALGAFVGGACPSIDVNTVRP